MFEVERDRLLTRYRLTIETLSPLHIGSGESPLLEQTPDFLRQDRKLLILDPAHIGDGLNRDQIEWLMEGTSLRELLAQLPPAARSIMKRYELDDPGNVHSIHPHIKLVDNSPYLPGSSIKGALRTALAGAMLRGDEPMEIREQNLDRSAKYAARSLETTLFGADAHHDLLRAFRVTDSEAMPIQSHLELRRATIFSLQRDEPDMPVMLEPKGDAYSFHLETIPEGKTIIAQAQCDRFLLEPSQADKLGYSDRTSYIVHLTDHARAFAGQLIVCEWDFYRRHNFASAVSFYEHLAVVLKGLDPTQECLLQLGWGGGWTSKTIGMLLDKDTLSVLRAKYKMGRRGSAHFPKSRRLVQASDGSWVPLGWVKVRMDPLSDAALIDHEHERFQRKLVQINPSPSRRP